MPPSRPPNTPIENPAFVPHGTAEEESDHESVIRVGLTKANSGNASSIDLVWTPPGEISSYSFRFEGIQPEVEGTHLIFRNVPIRDSWDQRNDIIIHYNNPPGKLVDTFVADVEDGSQGFTLTHWSPEKRAEIPPASRIPASKTQDDLDGLQFYISMYSTISPQLSRDDTEDLVDFLQSGSLFFGLRVPIPEGSEGSAIRIPVVNSGDYATAISLYDYRQQNPLFELRMDFAPEYQSSLDEAFPEDPSWNWVALTPETEPPISLQGSFPLPAGLWEVAATGALSLPDAENGCEGCSLELMVCWLGAETPPVLKAFPLVSGTKYQGQGISCVGPEQIVLGLGSSLAPPIQITPTVISKVSPPEQAQVHFGANYLGASSIGARIEISSDRAQVWKLYGGAWDHPDLSRELGTTITISSSSTFEIWAVRDIGTGETGMESLSLNLRPTNSSIAGSWATAGVLIGDWVPPSGGSWSTWLPVATHASGAQASLWRSDLGLCNSSNTAVDVEIDPGGGTKLSASGRHLGAGQQLILEDFLSELGLNTSVPIIIKADSRLLVSSRTYNAMAAGAACLPSGTLGQFLPASGFSSVFTAGDTAFIPQLIENGQYRCNIALTNTGDTPASATVHLHRSEGTEVGSFDLSLEAGQWKQENRPFFNIAGEGNLDAGYAIVEISLGNGIIGYGSVVDNITNDPTTIPLFAADSGSETSWIPVAVHSSGANNSKWRTDLGVLNPGTRTATVNITFMATGEKQGITLHIAAGNQFIISDLLDEFSLSGAGAVQISSGRELIVGSRTYSRIDDGASCLPAGTLGQYLASSADGLILSVGETAWIPQLIENQAYRSNIAFTNTGQSPAELSVKLFGGSGEKLAEYTVELDPRQWAQANRPFHTFGGQDELDAGYAIVEVISGDGIIGYGSVVDNITNDPTTIPLMR